MSVGKGWSGGSAWGLFLYKFQLASQAMSNVFVSPMYKLLINKLKTAFFAFHSLELVKILTKWASFWQSSSLLSLDTIILKIHNHSPIFSANFEKWKEEFNAVKMWPQHHHSDPDILMHDQPSVARLYKIYSRLFYRVLMKHYVSLFIAIIDCFTYKIKL